MKRAGSFSANFSPSVLEEFRSLCKEQGRQYTKVLERLAILYIQSNGSVLTTVPSTSEQENGDSSTDPTTQSTEPTSGDWNTLMNRVSNLESTDSDTEQSIQVLFKRLEQCEKKLGLGKYE